MGRKTASLWLQRLRRSPGKNGSLTHVDFSRAVTVGLAHGHRSLRVEDSLHLITEDPDMSKGQRDRTFTRTSLLCDPSCLNVPVVIVVSESWRASTLRTLILRLVCTSAKVKIDVVGEEPHNRAFFLQVVIPRSSMNRNLVKWPRASGRAVPTWEPSIAKT